MREKPITVMVVVEHVGLRFKIVELFDDIFRNPIEVIRKQSIRTALAKMKTQEADIFLIGMHFSVGSGEDLVAFIRKKHPNAPIVIYDDSEDADYYLDVCQKYHVLGCVTRNEWYVGFKYFLRKAEEEVMMNKPRMKAPIYQEEHTKDETVRKVCYVTKMTTGSCVWMYSPFSNEVEGLTTKNTMNVLFKRFSKSGNFVRINPSSFVNVDKIESISPDGKHLVLTQRRKSGGIIRLRIGEQYLSQVMDKWKDGFEDE